ncbi:DNA excision repair protein ERCC-6-like [Rhinophrynus dorsalis]
MVYRELYSKLFEHQKEGVAFLYSLYRDGRKGGILADDMGLGKTIQVIAFLSGMFDAEFVKYVLLVMPTTLISNWMKEFEKWTPGMRVAEFHGTSKKERSRNLEKIQRKSGIVITTYQMLINNWQQLSSYNGREFEWDYIILDEAHKIKSSSTKTAKSCQSIPSKNRILLTGTPIQNNLREMWALYDFACQGTLLGTSKTFKMEYENPITRAREKDSTPGEKALGLKISENLMKIIQPYFLRRTKSDVQNKKMSEQLTSVEANVKGPVMPSLTRKNDLIVWVYLSSIQEEVYRKFISLDQIKELLMTTRSPLAELNILKKLCDHPRLLSARACIQLGLEGDDYSYNEEGDHQAVTKFDHLSDETLIEESGKLLLLIDLLHKLKEEGHRTLVFSQSRKMLDMIDRILYNKQFKVMRIDGTVSLPEREKRISKFQSNQNYSVLLLTTQVGGVGLTLTAADRVVIFDPSWNPATDAQAVDRAYRIGQQENVVIYRLITCGTVEEKIYRRQIFKDSLIRQTTGDKKNPFRYFSKQELKELFSLDDTRISTTQIQLQNMHAAHRKTDTHLDNHIAYLHTLQIFGISDHDLIYTNEVCSQDEEQCENEHEEYYIQQRVQKAHELVQMESQMNEQFMEQIRKGTEGAWVRQMAVPEKPKERSLPHIKHHNPLTITVDLTKDDVGDVSCQMTSLVIEDSSEDEELPPVPFTTKSPNVNSNINGVTTSPDSIMVEKDLYQNNEKISNFSKHQNIALYNPATETNVSMNVVNESFNSMSVIEGDGFNVTAASKSITKAKTDLEMSTQIVRPLSNKTGELQQSCVADPGLEIKEECHEPSLSVSKSHLPCDFNLILDDSMEKEVQNTSMGDMEGFMETSVAPDKKVMLLLEESTENVSQGADALETSFPTEKEAILVLEDSVENSSLEGKVLETSMDIEKEIKNVNQSMDNCNLQSEVGKYCLEPVEQHPCEIEAMKSYHDNNVIGNCSRDVQANDELESEEDVEEIYFSTRKKPARRISSDSETENSVFTADENERVYSPFNSPSIKGMTASTPKLDKSISNSLFPQRRSLQGRRSIASRRSLIQVAVEEAEDVNDTIDNSSVEESEGEEDKLITEEAKDVGEEESVEPEEEPAGETLPQEESILDSSEEYESDSFLVKSDSKQEDSTTDESTGEVELSSGERMDCLAQENMSKQGVSLNVDHYASLVKRGKELKDGGKLKEALACFLEALDIKSGDPEIMMMTLNLYRQLPPM